MSQDDLSRLNGVDPDDGSEDDGERRYLCTSCDSAVRSRWFGPGSFEIGCECTTVPVVPQMGQAETPDNWIVEREECCRGVDVRDLETCYEGRTKDYKCPDCGAAYSWDGTMTGEPGGA